MLRRLPRRDFLTRPFLLAGTVPLLTRFLPAAQSQTESSTLGLFEGQTDVGTVLHPGSAAYDEANKTYKLTGSGDNMWFASDNFHLLWKTVSTIELALSADIALLGSGGDNHRKAVLMVRQNLNTDSAYADAAIHGDGLTSLQFRSESGAVTHEIQAKESAPTRLKLEKRGDHVYFYTAKAGEEFSFAGGSTRLVLQIPFYVGIGVCAHNKDAVQTVSFSHVELGSPGSAQTTYSTLQTVTVASTDARVAYVSHETIEYPDWSGDGGAINFLGNGKGQSISTTGGSPQPLSSSSIKGQSLGSKFPSPDGRQFAMLSTAADGDTLLSVTTPATDKPRLIAKFSGTAKSLGAQPWSPDGKRLAFVSYQNLK